MGHEIDHDHEHVEGGWNAEAGFVSDVDIEARLWNPRGVARVLEDKYGWTESDIRGFLGENLMRVYAAVWE